MFSKHPVSTNVLNQAATSAESALHVAGELARTDTTADFSYGLMALVLASSERVAIRWRGIDSLDGKAITSFAIVTADVAAGVDAVSQSHGRRAR